MHRLTLIAAVAAFVAVGVSAADEPKDDKIPTKDQLKQLQEMMTTLHKGEKAPLARVAAEVKKDSPDWEQLAKDVKGFVEMGKALDEYGHYGRSGYIGGAAALTKAIDKKDREASAKAFTAFRRSCSGCHYGNPAR